MITNEDGEVKYTIKYNVKIENYKGKATVKVVDTLPAGIKLELSDLKQGTYNATKKTITWEEEWVSVYEKDLLIMERLEIW